MTTWERGEGQAVSGEGIRVLVADDQQLVRGGFRMLLDSQPDIRVVAEAADGEEAVERASSATVGPVDVILMDVRMPRMDGIEATRRIVDGGGDTAPRIIILTTFALDEYVFEAIRAGASGFLLKDAEPEELLAAVRTVHRGDAVIAPRMTRSLIDAALGSTAPPPATTPELDRMREELTDREEEVLRLVAQGMSNAEIADALTLSETTVKTHVAHILQKTASRDRVQAVVFAFESGLVRVG